MELVNNIQYKKQSIRHEKRCEAATEYCIWIVTTDYTDTAMMHILVHAHTHYSKPYSETA